ncbi:MAG: nitroreductase family protein, partial [bacterium]|nr:nitroreductase family protein [bacterium]
MDKKETGALIANFIGLENHSERMLGSLSALIGSNLVSWPQLGSTALLNGSALTYAVRRITNGNHLTSGRVSFSLDDLFGQESDVQMNRKRETPNTARAPVRHLNISREVEEILDAARFAPSADNTQPWRVVIENESTFLLYHVPERDMTPYDSGQRTSFMSHGAFIENLCIAAARQGKHAAYALETPSSINKWLVARITLQNAKDNLNTNSKVLYEAIFKRRTNRKPYRKEKLSDIVKQHLLTAAQDLGWGEIKILDYPQPKVAAAAALSGQIMFQNLAVHKGLFEHIRWSTEEAERTKDGFLIDTFELPYPAKLVFKLAQSTDRLAFLNRTVKLAENIPTGMQDLYEQSGAFIGLISDKKEFSDYLMLGRLMQRIWLQGTIDNIYLQPIGAICFFKDM